MMFGAATRAGVAAPDSAGRPIFACYSGSSVKRGDHQFLDCPGVQTRSLGGIEERILTPEQLARREKCERDKTDAIADWRTKDRENKNLLAKYPDAPAMRKQQDADLASARESVARSYSKLADLDKERKRLALEREFYPPPNTVPERLQRQIDDNDALVAAQQLARKRAEDDSARIGANFDALGKKMTGLWAGKADPQPAIDCSVEKLFGTIPRR